MCPDRTHLDRVVADRVAKSGIRLHLAVDRRIRRRGTDLLEHDPFKRQRVAGSGLAIGSREDHLNAAVTQHSPRRRDLGRLEVLVRKGNHDSRGHAGVGLLR